MGFAISALLLPVAKTLSFARIYRMIHRASRRNKNAFLKTFNTVEVVTCHGQQLQMEACHVRDTAVDMHQLQQLQILRLESFPKARGSTSELEGLRTVAEADVFAVGLVSPEEPPQRPKWKVSVAIHNATIESRTRFLLSCISWLLRVGLVYVSFDREQSNHLAGRIVYGVSVVLFINSCALVQLWYERLIPQNSAIPSLCENSSSKPIEWTGPSWMLLQVFLFALPVHNYFFGSYLASFPARHVVYAFQYFVELHEVIVNECASPGSVDDAKRVPRNPSRNVSERLTHLMVLFLLCVCGLGKKIMQCGLQLNV